MGPHAIVGRWRMPVHYQIYPEAAILVVRTEGVITQAERAGTMLAWLADPQYPACIDALCDFSAAESVPTQAELDEVVTLLAKHLPSRGPKKVAIVAPNIITFGVARVFEDMVNQAAVSLEVKVFVDREHAWAWLRPATSPVDQGLS